MICVVALFVLYDFFDYVTVMNGTLNTGNTSGIQAHRHKLQPTFCMKRQIQNEKTEYRMTNI